MPCGKHDGRVEGGVRFQTHGTGVVAAELSQLDEKGLDAFDVATEHYLILGVHVRDQDLVDWGHYVFVLVL